MEEHFKTHYTELVEESENKLEQIEKTRQEIYEMTQRQQEKKTVDLGAFHTAASELEEYIKNNSPLVRVMLSEKELEELEKNKDEDKRIADHRWVKADKYIEDGKKSLGEAYNERLTLDEVVSAAGVRAPKVAVYYEDILSGFKYAYNGDNIFDSASVMKAPYVTSILEALAKYESGKLEIDQKDKEKYTDEFLAEIFDLEKTVVLDHETMDEPGSGVLVDAQDGSEYTYKELLVYSLKNSDNIAFSLIKKHFTNKWYYDYTRALKLRSPLSNYMHMSANEAGEFFKNIYYFSLRDDKYGAFMRECMSDSAHSVLSAAVLGRDMVAHKYGWDIDAYHDAAIVYGERPYIAIVFTDIDSGGADADRYVREIFKRIEKLHTLLG